MDTFEQARKGGLAADRERLGRCSVALIDACRRVLARARLRHLGDARAAAPLRLLQGDGLGGLRPRRQGGRALRPARPGRGLARHARPGSTPRSASNGFDTERNTFRAAYGETTARCQPAAAGAGRLHRRPTIRASSARSRRSSATCWSTASSSATTPHETDDGLQPGEGAFLACSFWLADAYVSVGRHDDADKLFERLLSIRNDLGLLAEEYDTANGRLIGNFPQAFSHVGLINTAST